MSLRRTLSVVTIVLTALALASATSTIQLTNYLERTVNLLRTNLESVRVGQQIEIDLLAYSRSSNPEILQSLEMELQRELQTAKQYVTTTDEARMLADATTQINSVVQLRQSTGGIPAEMRSDIEKALGDLRNFINVNVAQAHELEDNVAHVNLIAERFSIVVAAVLVAGVAAVLVWLGWFAFRPLFGIRDAMRAFAGGNRNVRAPEVGTEELRRIAEQFNEMSESLARQRENQMAFLAAVAHDLRNPIGALKMSTAILDPKRPLPDDQKVREVLGVVHRQIDHLNRMVGDLLDAYRIESGNLELQMQEMDVLPIVHESVTLFQHVSDCHKLLIDAPHGSIRVRCDSSRMSQVFNNLLSNAIKYSPLGGDIGVRLQQVKDQVLIEVSDTGIGIPPGDLQHIFEPFRRSRLTREDFPGVGLGLHVVRRIVEAHGGRIEVESKIDKGTTFRVWIPNTASSSRSEDVGAEHIA